MSQREPTQRTEAARIAGRRLPPPVRSVRTMARDWFRAAFVENATLKLVAFMLALTVFFLVHSDKRAVVNMTVGVSYSVPAGKVLASRPPDEVRLTVRGSRRLIKRVDEREIERIHVDLPDTTGEFVFQNEMIRLPAGLELVSINPASFPLRLERPEERVVPVEMQLVGELPDGYEVIGRSLEPDKVTITGAESSVRATRAVQTRAIPLEGRVQTFVEEVPLSPSEEFVHISDGVQTVKVRVQVGKKIGSKQLGKQKITIVAGADVAPETVARFVTEPAEVDVGLSGPILALETVDSVELEVRLMPTDLVPGAARLVPVVVRGLPEGVASEIRPSEVTVRAP